MDERMIGFFFNDTATTEIYTLSLHDALPICVHARSRTRSCSFRKRRSVARKCSRNSTSWRRNSDAAAPLKDRKSTRLNSSHANISYAVFCLKKKSDLQTYTIATTTRLAPR